MDNFVDCFKQNNYILMEGALGERLKREYHLDFDDNVVMGNLVYSQEGRYALKYLWHEYAEIAYNHGLPFIATTPTRRVNKERASLAGYKDEIIRDNVEYLKDIKKKQRCEMYIGGMIGCSGDAYTGQGGLDAKEAEKFHDWEIGHFALSGVDFLYAALVPTVGEALGIARAISRYNVPYIISFTIKADGCLIDGTPISGAISLIDHAIELKTSTPEYLANCIMRLQSVQKLKIIGGCCGTNNKHMNAIADKLTKDVFSMNV